MDGAIDVVKEKTNRLEPADAEMIPFVYMGAFFVDSSWVVGQWLLGYSLLVPITVRAGPSC